MVDDDGARDYRRRSFLDKNEHQAAALVRPTIPEERRFYKTTSSEVRVTRPYFLTSSCLFLYYDNMLIFCRRDATLSRRHASRLTISAGARVTRAAPNYDADFWPLRALR